MMLMLTRTYPDDTDVDPNSSEGVDLSFSEGVHTPLTETHPALSPKLLSGLVPNVSC
jgi:hypothetical protein